MPYIRNAQPAAIPLPGLRVDLYGTATAMPFGISLDRKTVYGAVKGKGAVLYQSVDDGTTWTTVNTFAENVVGIQELDDGEALVITQSGSSAPGYIYRSSGWTASHTSATWTKTLTSNGGYIRAEWAGGHTWSFGNNKIRPGTSGVGVCNEYGLQTTSSGSQTGAATHAYYTADYGATWTTILDLVARYPGIYPLHMHSTAYDPYWDRIWALFGDTPNGDGTSKAVILYSDDRGATWTPFALPAEWVGNGSFQSTTIAVLPECILLGSDNAPGYVRIARTGYRAMGDIQVTVNLVGNTGGQMIATKLHQNRLQPAAPILGTNLSVVVGALSPIMVSLDGGRSMTKLWEDTALRGSYKGPLGIVGPTYTGKILAWTDQAGSGPGGGTHWLLRGELIIPEPGLLDGVKTFTGDGTTTVFNIPHGLPTTPTRFMAWNERPAGAYTVTATSTNTVITYTTAPANALALVFAYRVAP